MRTQLNVNSARAPSLTLQGLPTAERDLIESCLRGDCEAQQSLYEQYSGKIYRLMFRMVGSSHADDLTQQVFLCVLRKLDKFHGHSLFSTWLYRVASNEALQFLRESHRDLEQPIRCELADNQSDATDQVDQRELLEFALSRLDPELRAIFLLRESEGLSYYDIALTLDIAEGTVASRLSRARRRMRELIDAASR